jgi:hypothetical protein
MKYCAEISCGVRAARSATTKPGGRLGTDFSRPVKTEAIH